MVAGFSSYNVDNDKRFRKALDGAIKEVGNLRFAMGEISRDIYKNTRKNFILKSSGKYPPLSPKYAAYKKKKKPGAPILVYSGRLRDSVLGPDTPDSILSIGETSLVQGTKVPYARYVQEGTSKMPVRKYLFIDDAQAGRIERIIMDYVISRLEVLDNGG